MGMSGNAGIRSMNMADSELRPVLWPGGNKAESLNDDKNPTVKPLKKIEKSKGEVVNVDDSSNDALLPAIHVKTSLLAHSVSVSSILRRHESFLSSNLSLNASCSSDASTDSFHSRASTGRMCRASSKTSRKKQPASKARNGVPESLTEGGQAKTRCAWAAVCTGEFHFV